MIKASSVMTMVMALSFLPNREDKRELSEIDRYASYARLYQDIALKNLLGKYAVQKMGEAPYCKKCHQNYLPEWAEGRCPYCVAEEDAKERIDELLKGDDE